MSKPHDGPRHGTRIFYIWGPELSAQEYNAEIRRRKADRALCKELAAIMADRKITEAEQSKRIDAIMKELRLLAQ